MIPWLKSFLYDQVSFASGARSLLFMAGELPQVIDFGAAGSELYWVGKVLQIISLGIRSGAGTPK